MSVLRVSIVASLFLILANLAIADLAPYAGPPRPEHSAVPVMLPVTIQEGPVTDVDPQGVAKIVIPKSLLSELPQTRGSVPTVASIIAGLALSIAAISLMLSFRKNRQLPTAAACLMIGLFLGGIVAPSVDAPLFAQPQRSDQPVAAGRIAIIFSDYVKEVILILPKEMISPK